MSESHESQQGLVDEIFEATSASTNSASSTNTISCSNYTDGITDSLPVTLPEPRITDVNSSQESVESTFDDIGDGPSIDLRFQQKVCQQWPTETQSRLIWPVWDILYNPGAARSVSTPTRETHLDQYHCVFPPTSSDQGNNSEEGIPVVTSFNENVLLSGSTAQQLNFSNAYHLVPPIENDTITGISMVNDLPYRSAQQPHNVSNALHVPQAENTTLAVMSTADDLPYRSAQQQHTVSNALHVVPQAENTTLAVMSTADDLPYRSAQQQHNVNSALHVVPQDENTTLAAMSTADDLPYRSAQQEHNVNSALHLIPQAENAPSVGLGTAYDFWYRIAQQLQNITNVLPLVHQAENTTLTGISTAYDLPYRFTQQLHNDSNALHLVPQAENALSVGMDTSDTDLLQCTTSQQNNSSNAFQLDLPAENVSLSGLDTVANAPLYSSIVQKDNFSNSYLSISPVQNARFAGVDNDRWPVRNPSSFLLNMADERQNADFVMADSSQSTFSTSSVNFLQDADQSLNVGLNNLARSDATFSRAPGYERECRRKIKTAGNNFQRAAEERAHKTNEINSLDAQQVSDQGQSNGFQEGPYYNMWLTTEINADIQNRSSTVEVTEMLREDMDHLSLENSTMSSMNQDVMTDLNTFNSQLKILNLAKVATINRIDMKILEASSQMKQLSRSISQVEASFAGDLCRKYLLYSKYMTSCKDLKKHVQVVSQRLTRDLKRGFSIDMSVIEINPPAFPEPGAPEPGNEPPVDTNNGNEFQPSDGSVYPNFGYSVYPEIRGQAHPNIGYPVYPNAGRSDDTNVDYPFYSNKGYFAFPNFGYPSYPNIEFPAYPNIESTANLNNEQDEITSGTGL